MRKKALRKISILFFIIYMLAAVCPAAFAESRQYRLAELKMDISIADDMLVITRDTDENDPVFEQIGTNYADTMQIFKASDIYLQGISGISENAGSTLTLTMTETQSSQAVVSYSRLSEDELAALKAELLENNIYTDADVIDVNGRNYIVLAFEDKREEQTVYGIQYNTVENGQNINITLQTTVAALTRSDIEPIENAVNSISFSAQEQEKAAPRSAAAVAVVIAAIVVTAVLITLMALLLKHKKTASADGFDVRENSILYKLTAKNREKNQEKSRLEKEEKRRQMIEKINSGENYDVFND